MNLELINEIKNNMLKNELNLFEYASLSSNAIRLKEESDEDIRPAYFHDVDRIIHSLSYTRYVDKTQVFSNNDNDHLSKRIIHVQLVSKIARTIGRALNLNEDLIEAISLGHDLGHVPFGHLGESILNELSLKYDDTYFMHNVQSVRNLMSVEDNGNGKNLTIQVLDGILCHNGEILLGEYKPTIKTKEEFLEEYQSCYKDKNKSKALRPMTLEGCVVRISDIIAYVGRDLEDAIRINVIKKEDIPDDIIKVLGQNNKEIVNTIVLDIINNSYGKNYIKMSDNINISLNKLIKFNYENIYNKVSTKEEIQKYKEMFESLFKFYLQELETNQIISDINKHFLSDMSDEYLNSTTNDRKVIDYIAGMTDDYFKRQYEKYISKI